MSGSRTETIRPATAGDMVRIRAILSESGLPADDVADGAATFLVAESSGTIVGTIGLEQYPPNGLLRSAAVLPSFRDRGLGAMLVDAILREARDRGLIDLVLLTTTAEKFFGRMGFNRIERGTLDGAIIASTQFSGTTCATAVAMRRAVG